MITFYFLEPWFNETLIPLPTLYSIAVKPKTYYRDGQDDSDVSGIIVVETGDEGVRVTENRDDVHWSAPYWMPEQQFRANTESDAIEKVGVLPDEKFNKVMGLAGVAQ